MAAPWDDNEKRIFRENITDGFSVQRMKELIPSRRQGGAIQLKARDFGFGVKTSKVDDITRFYADIKSRNGGSRVSTETDDIIATVDTLEDAQLTTHLQSNSFEHLEPALTIVPYDGFSANELAVKMLRDNRLEPTPKIIYYLSIHILEGGL